MIKNTLALVYRAMSKPKKVVNGGNSGGGESFVLSTIGISRQTGKGTFETHEQLLAPTYPWERFGCEDPRATKLGDTYYIFYTALSAFPFRAEGIKAAVALSDDMKTIKERHLVTPFNAKAMSLFPEKINGKFTIIFAAHTDEPPAKIAIAQFDHEADMWNEAKWREWHDHIDEHTINIPRRDTDQVEVGAAPIHTRYGWLLVYSHIQNYYTQGKQIFGIQAVLLDLNDPRKIIAKTRGAFIVPETTYEKKGIVSDITFPSGALITKGTKKDGSGDKLHVFYGGADTVTAEAEVSLEALVSSMEFTDSSGHGEKVHAYKHSHTFNRPTAEPLMEPIREHAWESRAVFNPAAFDLGGSVQLLYRAMSDDNTSTVGLATSKDGIRVSDRLTIPIYTPRASFEEKRIPGGNSGCEDPRVTFTGNRLYMTYTAYNGVQVPSIAMTSISIRDFKKRIWKWTAPIVISKDGVDDKDGVLFPVKLTAAPGKPGSHFALIHRVDHNIVIDYSDTLEFLNRNAFEHRFILGPRPGMWDSKKVGVAGTPFMCDKGWIMLYHGIGEDGFYRLGAALLDGRNPEKVIGRTAYPIFEPETPYERSGQVGNVVFPCGAVVRKGIVYIYYGAGDSMTGVATISLAKLIEAVS
ncbi:MAG: hypothetical protein JWO73_498 [Candidatus Taylorbacteria bacterium]|nr:hypothetical protein [Candidatus Taylorbacteria bacterium]